MNDEQLIAENLAANEAYIQMHFPDDIFIHVEGLIPSARSRVRALGRS